MTRVASAILLATTVSVIPLVGVLAQNNINNPDNMAGTTGSQVAIPQRPGGASNPALTTGTLPKAKEATVPPDKNPNKSGATGHTVVPGNKSSISADRKKQ